MKIVIPDDFPSFYDDYPEALQRLRALGTLEVYRERAAGEDEVIARLAGAEVALNVRSYTPFNARVVAALSGLRMVSVNGTGVDNFDLDACSRHGVVVTNTPGIAAVSVAELTMALVFAVARQVALADRLARGGEWRHHPGMELRGKTLGLVGLGAIGREAARLGRGIGMEVIAWSLTEDPVRTAAVGVEVVSLDELLRRSDVVSIHLRGSARVQGLIGRRELGLMKPGTLLVNTARAAILDEDALLEALQSRRLGGAGIDAWWTEPVPPGSPWLTLDNVVISPHVGWMTAEAAARLAMAPVENIEAYLRGEAQNVVNPEALSHAKQARPPGDVG